ncbi:MAG TPA: alpha/beta hydrolase [Conexibacter sp.]|nr:alpha/beta hydrolase [Conexibacter sp.]
MHTAPATRPDCAELERELAQLDAERLYVEGDVRLHLLRYHGSADVPALVLPGITSPAVTWDFVARRLTGVVRPHVLDLRGRGFSGAPARGYALADYAADVRRVVEQLGLERPVLIGHSLGARIAAAVAAEDPQLARALVLIEPPLSGPVRPYPTTLSSFFEQLDEAAAGCTAADMRRHFPHWPEAELELRARWLPTCSAAAVAETHSGFERDRFEPLWERLRPPLFLIHGAESPVVTSADAQRLTEVNRAAVCVAVPGAGHMLPWERPDATAVLTRVLQVVLAAEATAPVSPSERKA